MADVYELNTIADLLKIPPEKLGDCLRDIEYAVELCHLAGGEHAAGMSFDSFKWTDDGKHDVDMSLNGEPLLKLSVTEEPPLSHAAGQDGEQCRAASGDSLERIASELDQQPVFPSAQARALWYAGLADRIRALSRGVPERDMAKEKQGDRESYSYHVQNEELARHVFREETRRIVEEQAAIAAQRKDG